MILAALALALQPAPAGAMLDPQAAGQGFLSLCARYAADPAALRAAIRRSPLGFVRGADEVLYEIYRARAATIRFKPGTGCALDAGLASRSHGDRAIAIVSEAIGQPMPPGAVNHPGTAARYSWERPARAGQIGLAATLEWGRMGPPEDRGPVLLKFWAYVSDAP